jgi:hypothetical protein
VPSVPLKIQHSAARPQPEGTPHPITPSPSSLSPGEREEGEGSWGEGSFLNERASECHPTAVPRSIDHFLFCNTENRTKSLPKKQEFAL